MSAELETIVSQLSDTALLAMVDSDPASLLIEAITAANAAIEARGGKAALVARTTSTTKSEAALDDASVQSPPTASPPTPSPSSTPPGNDPGTTTEPAPSPIASAIEEPVSDGSKALDGPAPLVDAWVAQPSESPVPGPVETAIPASSPSESEAVIETLPALEAASADANSPREVAAIRPEPVPITGILDDEAPLAPATPAESAVDPTPPAAVEAATNETSGDLDQAAIEALFASGGAAVAANDSVATPAGPQEPATPTSQVTGQSSPDAARPHEPSAAIEAATPAPSADLDQAAIEALFASDGPATVATDPIATPASPQEPVPATSQSAGQDFPDAATPTPSADDPASSPAAVEPTAPVPTADPVQAAIEVNPPINEAAAVQHPEADPASTFDAAPEEPSPPNKETPSETANRTASATRQCPKRRRRIIVASVAMVLLLAAGTFTLRKQWHSAKPMPAQARELPTAQFVAALDDCRSIYEKTAAAARSQIAEAMSPARDNADSPFTTRLTLVRLEYRRQPTGVLEALERVRAEFETLRHRQQLPASLEADFEKFGQIIARHHRFLTQDQSEGLPQWFNDYVRLSAVSARILKATSRIDSPSSQTGADHTGGHTGTEAGHQE